MTTRLNLVDSHEVVTIQLNGLTAIRIDPTSWTIAVDGTSGDPGDCRNFAEWRVINLKDEPGSVDGDFHRMKPANECNDWDCVREGQHVFG